MDHIRNVLACGLLLLITGTTFAEPQTIFPPRDFVEYWSAARVVLRGGDPYDGAQLLPMQREVTGQVDKTEAVMLWTPPWTLPLYIPFGFFEPSSAQLLWLTVQLGCVLIASVAVWRVYRAPRGNRGFTNVLLLLIPLIFVACFAPTWWLLAYGQNTGFVLFGLAGFLYFRERGYPVAAGVLVALTAIKPHVLALFGMALILDARVASGRRALCGGIGAIIAATVVLLVIHPSVFSEFTAAVQRPSTEHSTSLADWQVPLFSFHIRHWLDPDKFVIQFIPVLLGCLAVIPYRWLRGKHWNWHVETPRLVFASALLAPYGGWVFDLVILIVPIVDGLTRLLRNPRLIPISVAITVYLLISFATLLTPFILKSQFGISPGLQDYFWLTPATVVWYLAVVVSTRNTVNPVEESSIRNSPQL